MDFNPTELSDADTSLDLTVLQGGYCVGCGACASLPDAGYRMEFTEDRNYQAVKSDPKGDESLAAKVCPFSDEAPNETEIAKQLFGPDCQQHDKLGYFLGAYAGHVETGEYRTQGSSGGMATWIAQQLLSRGMVDAIAHIHGPLETTSTDQGVLFKFGISHDEQQLTGNAKTRYYPVEMSEVIQQIRSSSDRIAFIGVPCFIKAIRLLCQNDADLNDKIKYCISLVCGHLKSSRWADLSAWQCGIPPADLKSIDFRKKLPDRPATAYGVQVSGLAAGEQQEQTRPVAELFGKSWAYMFFAYQACDFCDDILGETADVSVGDAWLAPYKYDSRGTNVLVTRNPEIEEILRDGMQQGTVSLDPLGMDDVATTQAGNLRHRHDGLAYRLSLAKREGRWTPKKRIQPCESHLSSKRRQMFQLRIRLRKLSHSIFREAVAKNDLEVFIKKLRPLTVKHDILAAGGLFLLSLRKINRLGRRAIAYARGTHQ
ncbi:MAG: coenzyme F420 hydrogenase [Planctomycetaceae bacterium]|nr:coenzyme F420 hydrogenase [Planctomycetaceae bacterium]